MKNSKTRILVADDELGMRDLLAWELGRRGYEVVLAEDGAEAARLAQEGRFDVVLTDLTMPRRDGLSLLKEILARDPGAAVIIATGFGTVEAAVEAMKLGAQNFLLKPYDMMRLAAALSEAEEVRS